ncbi:MAG TPA: hypothetical protein VFB13_12020 [Reyranella sp.]|nr:hypothetical protein [Reyranella sp.]
MNIAKLLPMTAALLFAASAFANDADFVLKNKTGYQIDEVYISLPSSKNWGPDIMGTHSLGDGEKVKITFPHGNGACKFDIKVKYNDGDASEWSAVDLCEYETITLYWDKKAQQTRAVGE